MVAGTWFNQDGLYLQYGTQKAVEEVGGDYLVYGETREIEQLIPLVPMAIGPGTSIQVPAPPTTFSGTTTAAAAGIQSLTTFVPLQITPVTTVSGGILNFTTSQLFFESVEIDTIIGAAGGTSLNIGLVTNSQPTSGTNTTFVQCTPNAGVQLVNGILTASMATSGQKVVYTINSGATSGLLFNTSGTGVAGAGAWLGTVPLVTNAITPLPNNAWISTIASGTFTNGLIKMRLRYTLYGSISQ
jgi:hypothetical protein